MGPILRPCLDCGQLSPRSRCPEHERAFHKSRKARGATGQRGTSAQWRRKRRIALVRDGWACTVCGSGVRLHVHHRDGNSANNAIDNLVTLCHDHHVEAHRA